MNPGVTRLSRFLLWLVVTLLVTLAVAVTALRIMLPELNRYQVQIQNMVNEATGLEFHIDNVSGFWRNTHPSISLQGLKAEQPEGSTVGFSADKIEIEFDLIQSLMQMQPVIAELTTYQLKLDLRRVDLFSQRQSDATDSKDNRVLQRLDNLFLRQLDDFSLLYSAIQYRSVAGEERQLDIEKLRWKNSGRRHRAEGVVSIAEKHINSLSVNADFIDHGSLQDVSGEFYVGAENLRITPWLTTYLQTQTGIDNGQISFNSWVTLEHSHPQDAYVELKPSDISWREGTRHDLMLESGIFQLVPSQKGWQVSGHSLRVRTDDKAWPELDVAFNWQPDKWRLNVSQLDLAAIAPLVKLAPDSDQTSLLIDQLQPGGLVEDLRIAMGKDRDSLQYSARLSDGSLAQWQLLPELHHLSATLTGNARQAHARLSLIDDVLPYGEVFQAPLNIKQGAVNIVWQKQSSGWSLWADKVTVATPDLQVLGAFRLDFPEDQNPFLSFYAEADLYNAGQTWRYLPTLALGRTLTDYLSTAIQAGQVDTAKLVWYGALNDFPYHEHNGVFQAWVGLKHAKFSFDTAWPPITNLQLDLLFHNDAMYLDSHDATLMNVKAQRITGRIPELAEGGHIEIEASATAQGNDLRDYMTATPLVDSVGAALTAVQVDGEVKSAFQLNIPFDGDKEPRAWGWADLTDNHVEIDAPAMTLEKVSGRIRFDNDVVQAAGLAAGLLKQPVSIDFKGESAANGYDVNIDVLGDWKIKPLSPYLGSRWTQPLTGHAPWTMDLNIQLNDVGFTYQIDTQADLRQLSSRYPYPLNRDAGTAGKARLQASGNQQSVTARLSLPSAKYQAEIDISKDKPVLQATNLVLGSGSFKISPVVGHQAQVRTDKLNLDEWLALLGHSSDAQTASSQQQKAEAVEIPLPERVDVNVAELTLGGIDWHDVNFDARKKNLTWYMSLDSQEAKGEASYLQPYDLSVVLERLHVYIPELENKQKSETSLFRGQEEGASLISDFDREFHDLMPNLTLNIDDFWLQGYKVGKLTMDLQRTGDQLEWKQLTLQSGNNKVAIQGAWSLTDTSSHTNFNLDMQGQNNSELMERFGISSGIQQAPFELSGNIDWDGAPWSMRVDTLKGNIKTKLGKGMVSDVSGAARLLGLFSLDSIIRKMQLDFSDVFDKGMAFNSISGSGEIRNGIFVTNDIKMDAVAGEMKIKGMANLNTRMVDAEVNFTPDITSGIPVLTAFAVTPQTALYVLAITTVLSPVVEVFTQVDYEVKGPLDSPTVKELSRSKGEFKLPESLRLKSKE